MDNEPERVEITFDILIPSNNIVSAARNHIDSNLEHVRAVAKALLDLTAVASKVKNALALGEDIDLAPYFDFWFADAIDAANAIKDSSDESVRYIAETLIEQENLVLRSKTSFLAQIKKLGYPPHQEDEK
jgi:hypothetical protein